MTEKPENSIQGGRGEVTLRDLADPHRARGAAKMIARALEAGYIDIFAIDYQEVKKLARALSKCAEPRAAAAGLKLLVEMAKHDLKLLELVDGAQEVKQEQTVVVYNVPPPRQLEG